jgi:hypothetical protein
MEWMTRKGFWPALRDTFALGTSHERWPQKAPGPEHAKGRQHAVGGLRETDPGIDDAALTYRNTTTFRIVRMPAPRTLMK